MFSSRSPICFSLDCDLSSGLSCSSPVGGALLDISGLGYFSISSLVCLFADRLFHPSTDNFIVNGILLSLEIFFASSFGYRYIRLLHIFFMQRSNSPILSFRFPFFSRQLSISEKDSIFFPTSAICSSLTPINSSSFLIGALFFQSFSIIDHRRSVNMASFSSDSMISFHTHWFFAKRTA